MLGATDNDYNFPILATEFTIRFCLNQNNRIDF